MCNLYDEFAVFKPNISDAPHAIEDKYDSNMVSTNSIYRRKSLDDIKYHEV